MKNVFCEYNLDFKSAHFCEEPLRLVYTFFHKKTQYFVFFCHFLDRFRTRLRTRLRTRSWTRSREYQGHVHGHVRGHVRKNSVDTFMDIFLDTSDGHVPGQYSSNPILVAFVYIIWNLDACSCLWTGSRTRLGHVQC